MTNEVDLYSQTRKHCYAAKTHLERAIAYCRTGLDEPLDWALDEAFGEILSANQSQPRYQESSKDQALKCIQKTQDEIEQLIKSVNDKYVLVQMIQCCSKRLEEIAE